MTKEEMMLAIKEALDGFKANLKDYLTKEGLQLSFKEFKADLLKEFGESIDKEEILKSVSDLDAVVKAQGEMIEKIVPSTKETPKSIKDILVENKEMIIALKDGSGTFEMNVDKSVIAASITSDTGLALQAGVGQIARTMPYVREQLGINVVNLGKNSHGEVIWYEQEAITDNSATVAEGAAPTASDITWIKKSLGDARLKDQIKVSVDQLQDVDFIASEVQRLLERNMRILENDELVNGSGSGNHIKGLIQYASPFVTTGIEIPTANLFDLIGKVKTQIAVDGKGAWVPNAVTLNNADLDDEVRYVKDEEGRYLFPEWAYGNATHLSGAKVVENPAVAANSLLMGDFSVATLYIWNNLTVQLGYVGNDFVNGLVTIMAYERANLRVNAVDAKSIVSITDLDVAIAAITEPIA